MAEKNSGKNTKPFATEATETELSDWQKLMQHVITHPWHYVAGVAFILFCAGAGALYGISQEMREREIMSGYAGAIAEEDPALSAAQLETIAESDSRWTPEIVYMLGETAIRAQEYEKAKEAFTRVVNEFSSSDFAPKAADGLAFLEENAGNLDAALKAYQEIQAKWGNTFTGRLQPFNIARVYEAQENLEAAIAAYQEQKDVFPDSAIAARAEMALARLEEAHPDLFPEVVVVEEDADEHAGHDHGDEDADEHVDHDHGDEDADEHAGHDHGDEDADEHAGHDHGDEDADEHAGHDHGDAAE